MGNLLILILILVIIVGIIFYVLRRLQDDKHEEIKIFFGHMRQVQIEYLILIRDSLLEIQKFLEQKNDLKNVYKKDLPRREELKELFKDLDFSIYPNSPLRKQIIKIKKFIKSPNRRMKKDDGLMIELTINMIKKCLERNL